MEARVARRLGDLPPAERRAEMARSALRVLVAWFVIFGAYFLNPIGERSGTWAFTRLGFDVAVVAAVVAWQIRRIETADVPEVRAVEALGIVVALFLCAFSGLYLGLSTSLPSNFSEPLDHVRALYFTVTVFSTVGFGDIVPKSDTARLIVSAQMLLDLALIGAVVRLLFNRARTRFGAEPPGAGSGQASGPVPESARSSSEP